MATRRTNRDTPSAGNFGIQRPRTIRVLNAGSGTGFVGITNLEITENATSAEVTGLRNMIATVQQ